MSIVKSFMLLDQCLRRAVSEFREKQIEPFDEISGLYVSDQQVDSLLEQNSRGRHSSIPALNGKFAKGTREVSLLREKEFYVSWRQEWLNWLAELELARKNDGASIPYAVLIHEFALTPMEAFIVLLALASELSLDYERIFAYLHNDVRKTIPSVALALELWCGTAGEKVQMRTIFHPQAPLFKSNLLRLIGQSDSPLLSQQLQLIPSVVEFLCGQLVLAPKLSDCASLWPVTEPIQPVWPDHTFIHTLTQQAHLQPIYLFVGKQGLGQVATARYLAQVAKCPLLQVKGSFLREQFGSLEEGISHVIRDGRLAHAFLYIDASGSLENLETDSWLSLLLPYPYTVIISREEPWVLEGQAGQRPLFQIQFSYPNHQQRQQLWQLFLENLPIASDVDTSILATQFSFTPQQIKAIIQTAHHKGQWHKRPINQADLFAASRSHSQQGLRALATHISPHVSCNDLVVPDLTANLLKQIISRMRHQAHVFETWGWAQKTGRNQGLYALFQGKPGTGKTMAAEAIAHELGCDLYQVDLSLVVSKYIGETEKHLGRIFHLAEQSNAVLFFDEADALFGKRSEVRDSHDKYANMETSYLLQRMEQHSGLVILATNFQVNMDTAFLRRLHFVVTFPLPDVTSRERIWRTTFPQTMPLSPEVDFHLLAKRFELAGGHIRNIMLQASFFAAETRQIVGMKEILLATQQEYRKLGLMADVALFNIDRTNES